MRDSRAELASLLVRRKTFTITSESRRHMVDIRPQVEEAVLSAGVQQGLALVNCMHTTCSVLISEADQEGLGSFARLMKTVINDNEPYRHDDLRWSDCERGNAAAHLRASLLGPGVTVGIARGVLALELTQSILLAEWDGPRSRTVDVQILGT